MQSSPRSILATAHAFSAKFIALGLTVLFLAGCVTPPPPQVSAHFSHPFQSLKVDGALSGAGALVIRPWGQVKGQGVYFTLNRIPLASEISGYIWVPLKPGSYNLEYTSHDAWTGGTTYQKMIAIQPQQTVYLSLGNAGLLASPPLQKMSRQEFLDRFRVSERSKRIQLLNPVQAFLPEEDQALIDNCLSSKQVSDCKRAIANIPAVLMQSSTLDAITALLAGQPSTVIAETKQSTTATEANATANIASPTLSPNIERDRLMVQIADLFKANKAADAVLLFERLDSLPVPIDPISNYYWAQALLASGDRSGAEVRLARFLETIDRDSPFYAPALRLMTQIKG